ncbi:hypothetical protein T484DRAFT_1913617 [Baffinella frigidus]|nr:hypothetical protein T484DRAFT_1913617 [Cryptophyta sp. CCMP2293]
MSRPAHGINANGASWSTPSRTNIPSSPVVSRALQEPATYWNDDGSTCHVWPEGWPPRAYAPARILMLAYEREGPASNTSTQQNQAGGGHAYSGGSDEEASLADEAVAGSNEALLGSKGELQADAGRDRHSDSSSRDSSAILVEGSEGGFCYLDGDSDADE